MLTVKGPLAHKSTALDSKNSIVSIKEEEQSSVKATATKKPVLEPVMSTAGSELLSDNSDANLFLSNYLKSGDTIKMISRSVRVQGIDTYSALKVALLN